MLRHRSAHPVEFPLDFPWYFGLPPSPSAAHRVHLHWFQLFCSTPRAYIRTADNIVPSLNMSEVLSHNLSCRNWRCFRFFLPFSPLHERRFRSLVHVPRVTETAHVPPSMTEHRYESGRHIRTAGKVFHFFLAAWSGVDGGVSGSSL